MARSLCQAIINLTTSISKPIPPTSRLFSLRTHSTRPKFSSSDLADPSSDPDRDSDPILQKLEDAVHQIIVRRSAPDWLPFLPGSSYWVPPSTAQSYGLTHLIDKLAPEDSVSNTTTTTAVVQGWPSSDYFIKDGTLHPAEVDLTSNTSSKSEDEEG